ncbi:MAG TPA: prepilin-type N-terminal cleavage/methylation domain-containing protein [Sedimentisphaerales bacterium]|jgi:prepilin-type N-terminal cleavage/methylation domain-containing protein|nr:prepilin-type N-terminal cleavage/methylation domain-containing protein [Sedimentisphaerales bacterium]HNU28084.1 prepilin-type N-terminal cleavage/methylation domain-containing protein [Sedimentisphaerales bacterium]
MSRRARAFTFVELMVSMVVTGILLSAVATLAFAMSTASRVSDDMFREKAYVRGTTLRNWDMVSYSKMICAAFDNHLVFWKADSNANGRIDVNEIAYLEYNAPWYVLTLWEFKLDPSENTTVLEALGLEETAPVLTELADPATKTALVQMCGEADTGVVCKTTLLQQCHSLSMTIDPAPPRTALVVISFDLANSENEKLSHYEMIMTRRVTTAHLLDTTTNMLVDGDDDD